MKRILFSLTAGVFIFSFAQAEMREFKNSEGKTIRAEILSATPTQVSIRLENGRTLTANVSVFSQDDQDYIAQWLEDHPIPLDLGVKFKTVSEGEEESRSGQVKTELNEFEVSLTNRGVEPVADCKMLYQIFKSKTGESDNSGLEDFGSYLVQEGIARFGAIAPKATEVLTTDLFGLSQFDSSGAEEKLLGIWIRVVNSEEKIVFEAKSNEGRLKDVEWFEPKMAEEEKAEE